jgi:hypothetical protein
MAWSTPLTAVASATLTAAQWNSSVRDNLLETAAAKATTAGRIFVATGTNTLAEREIASDHISTGETTTSTSFVDLATVGPTVTVTTGTLALVSVSCRLANSTSGISTYASAEISGATTTAAVDNTGVMNEGSASASIRTGSTTLFTLTPGLNTFRMKYRVISNTGSYSTRRVVVMAL